MSQGAIYIDDAGNPGAESGSAFLSATRKSWTAVVVPSRIAGDVSTAMDIFLDGVRGEFGAEELHFTDIYSGRGVWKRVSVERRMEVFDLMKSLAERFALPIVHQTASDETLNDHDSLSSLAMKPWDLNNVSHFGFLLLCSRVSRHVRKFQSEAPKYFELPMPLFVDEGLSRAGNSLDLPNWGDVFEGQKAQFCKSSSMLGIQIADFCAFAISRSQWVYVQQKLGAPVKPGDLEFLRTISSLNILDMPMVTVAIDNISKDSYEFALARDRKNKGLPILPNSSPRKR